MKSLKSRHNFVSIDASTNSMAFSYFKDGSLDRYGKIKFYGQDIYDKIVDTGHKTNGFFKQFTDAEYMIIEQPIYVNSPKTAAHLAMSHGALVSAAAVSGITHIASVSPIAWQNWAGNPRLTAAEKQAIRDSHPGKTASWYKSQERVFRKQRTIGIVNTHFGVMLSDDDVADAICIGWWTTENWEKVF